MHNQQKYIGLTDAEVVDSRREHGFNVLTPPKKTPLWRLYLEKYQDPIIEILLVAAVISLVLAVIEHQYVETIGIFLAIFLATTVGFIFEMDAARKFDMLTALNEEQKVKVVRNGVVCLIKRREIVVGDTVIVETGDEIPADGVLNEVNSLQVDESMLTGEPLTTKHLEEEADSHGAYPRNMLLRSTMVMNGRGVFVVTAVGDMTEIGRVARTSSEDTDVKTPLNIQLDRLGKMVNKMGFSLSILSFVLFLGHDILVNPLWHTTEYLGMAEVVLKYFMMAVTLIVMAVPEGLPMAVTLSLALNMRRMLKSNNLVRKLHACETMGAVTVICTDKTGTLTQNRMHGSPLTDVCDDRQSLYEAIAVNTTAHLDGQKGIGNPTEVALLLWLREEGLDYKTLRESVRIVEQVPFSTETKQMTTRIVGGDGKEHIYIKGAPEIVMAQCDMTDEERSNCESLLVEAQSHALRTLALAKDGRLQTLFGISDPVRQEVPKAVASCADAGIEVKIVTGDVDRTALEVARQIGIVENTNDTSMSITGAEFAALSDEEAMEVAGRIKVMSRARPQDKQRLVMLLQRRGEVVAVTGDGTNDAPALHHAHVGLSLGSGTNVAKEASDMTLLDDSFKSIVSAVMWGRSLYRNLQRFLFFQLVVNVVALLLVIAGSLVGTEMPLTVTQILWVNLIMDTFAALALSSLPPSREVLSERPRNQQDFILSRPIVKGILTVGILMFIVMFVFLLHCEYEFIVTEPSTWKAVLSGTMRGGIDRHELTLFFTAFVLLQWWNLFNAKAIGSVRSAFRRLYADKGLLLVLLLTFVGQWMIVEWGDDMFRCEPLSPVEWVILLVATSPVMIAGEIYRLIKRSGR